MSYNKFRKASIVFLIVVYVFIFCLGSTSFAITSDTIWEIEEGRYFLQNTVNEQYVESEDGYYSNLVSHTGSTYQQWEIIPATDNFYAGYYAIRNIYTGLYLTAPSDDIEGNYVVQLELSSYMADRQMWSFDNVSFDGNEPICTIQAKSQEEGEMYLASSKEPGLDGYDLIQSNFWVDCDWEWRIEPAQDVYLLGIDYNELGHDHTSALTSANNNYTSQGNISHLNIVPSSNTLTVRNYLRNAGVFILRAHGGIDDMGTYMSLDVYGANQIHSWDIYNYNSNIGIDMSNCYVAAFVGCYTSNHGSKSLPHAAVDAGARCAIGFATKIGCNDAERWTTAFAMYNSSGYSAEDAATRAVEYAGRNSSVASMEVMHSN